MRKSTQQITLTLLATVSVLSVAACDDKKSEARRVNACKEDPNSEDCRSGGRSHSSVVYYFLGRQRYGTPSYFGTPSYVQMMTRPNGPWVGFNNGTIVSRSSPGSVIYRPPGVIIPPSTTAGIGRAGPSVGSVARGGFGSTAAGHAGGGE